MEVEPIMSAVLGVGGNNNSKPSWEIGFARTSASASTDLVINNKCLDLPVTRPFQAVSKAVYPFPSRIIVGWLL